MREKRGWDALCVVLGLACAAGPARAQEVASSDYSQLSIEQLENVAITSVSKRPEPLSAAAASIFVISADDIRRSGASSLPEVLRLAPNLEIVRMNAFAYAITARGFNSPESSNKLLVLVDGRSVYSPLASTVFWENLDIPLENIERIEVVSGPGGTLYGANAVNGVVNIITRNSADTQGPMLSAGAGPNDQVVTMRYGGAIADAATFNVYATGFNRASTDPVSPSDQSRTEWAGYEGGFRFDAADGPETYSFEGSIYDNRTTDVFIERAWGGNVNGSWDHAFLDGSTLQVQAYADDSVRTEPGVVDELATYDLLAQHTTSLGWNDNFVWGGEFRFWREAFYSAGPFLFANPVSTITLGSAFAQDQIAIADDLKLTLGMKAEYNSYSGFDPMPDVRLAWQAAPQTLLWGAVSRAVRTPSKIDRELQDSGILIPSPNFDSENVIAYELGYRGEITPRVSLSVSLYYNRYDQLRSDELSPGFALPIQLGNGLAGNTYGAETWGNYTVTDWWRLSAGFNWLHKDLHLKPGHTDISLGQSAGQDPAYQAQLRSQMDWGRDLETDLMFRAIGKVTRSFTGGPIALVPAYVEADARVGWRVTDSLELSLAGYNLLHARHLEANDPSTYPEQSIERSFLVTLRKSF